MTELLQRRKSWTVGAAELVRHAWRISRTLWGVKKRDKSWRRKKNRNQCRLIFILPFADHGYRTLMHAVY